MSVTLVKEHVVSSHSPRLEVERKLLTATLTGEPSKRFGRQWWAMLVAIAALVGVAGGWYTRQAIGTANSGIKGGANEAKAVLGFAHRNKEAAVAKDSMGHLDTTRVEMVPRRGLLRLTGTLTADEQSCVACNITGIVAEVRVDRGSVVKKGDVMVQLDPTDAKNHLAEGIALAEELKAKLTWGNDSAPLVAEEQPEVKLAKASLALAASRKARAEILLPKRAIAADECEQYQSEYKCAVQRCRESLEEVQHNYQCYQTAVAKLAALRKAVTDTTITAPFDGIVSEKNVSVGEQVTGGFIASKVITLVRMNPVRLSLTMPQQSIAQIAPGRKVCFHVDSYPDKTFEAEVRYISPVVTSDTRSLLVEAVANNADGALRPGLFATAELEISEQQTDMLVPATAVQRAGEVAHVFVVQEGVARQQVVALGKEAKGKVEIQSGLTGRELLLSRAELFHDGDKVR